MSEKKERTSSSESVASSFGSCKTIVSLSSSDSLCEYDNNLKNKEINEKKVNNFINNKKEKVVTRRRQRENKNIANSPQIVDVLHLLIQKNQYLNLHDNNKK